MMEVQYCTYSIGKRRLAFDQFCGALPDFKFDVSIIGLLLITVESINVHC